MTLTRARAFAIVLVASVLSMTTGPLFATPPHEFCDARQHGCSNIDAVASCCCGEQSESNPSRTPADRNAAGAALTPGLTAASFTLDAPAVLMLVVHEGRPPLDRPLDLRILFSDLRI